MSQRISTRRMATRGTNDNGNTKGSIAPNGIEQTDKSRPAKGPRKNSRNNVADTTGDGGGKNDSPPTVPPASSSSALPSASPTLVSSNELIDSTISSDSCSSLPSASSSDSVEDRSSKYARLDHLLDQTSLFAQFLSERMPARFTAINKQADNTNGGVGKKSKQQKESHLAARSAELHELIAPNSGLELHPFQVAGIDWLISLYENGLNGILADEMGLGKTLQVILFLAFLRHQKVYGPFLVVAPLGTLKNWSDEIQRWTPQTPVMIYHGTKEERAQLRTKFLHANVDQHFPVVITSYEISILDSNYFKRIHWKELCVDEGHRIKNIECKLIQKLKQFPSENRLLLTGTPLQNSLPELWSLLHFLLPDVFASLAQFQSWFDWDEQNLSDQAGQEYVINAERDHLLVTKLHSILRPFVLRRIKSDVLKLADKREYTLYVPMTHMQRFYYESILDGTMKLAATSASSAARLNLRNILMQLRKVVNHPYLILSDEEEVKLGIDMEKRANQPRMKSLQHKSAPLSDDDDPYDLMDDIPIATLQAHLQRKSPFIAREDEIDELIGPISDEEEEEAESGDDEEDDVVVNASSKGRSRRVRSLPSTSPPSSSTPPIESLSMDSISHRTKRRKLATSIASLRQSSANSSNKSSSASVSFDTDPNRLIRVCGKLQLLSSLLPSLHTRGHRVLIFSQMTRVLDILEDFLELIGAPNKFRYCRIDGSTSAHERAQAIESFNTDSRYFIFLLSTRAGGLGLNLASADTVILYDSDWNPHCDTQATDRVHRLTQQKKVLVLRLLTPGSVEVGMIERATNKKQLEHLVLTKGKFHHRPTNHRNGNQHESTSEASIQPLTSKNWRGHEGIVSELVELFRMQPIQHQAIRTQIHESQQVYQTNPSAPSSSSSSAFADSSSHRSSRRSTKRKSSSSSPSPSPSPSSSPSPSPSPSPSLSTRSLPSVEPFHSCWLTQLLDRDGPPPPDHLPQSSYQAGYVHIRPHREKGGLMDMLTEHTNDGEEK